MSILRVILLLFRTNFQNPSRWNRMGSDAFLVQDVLRRRLVEAPDEHHRPPEIAPLPLVRLSLESPEGFAEGGANASHLSVDGLEVDSP